LVRLPEKKTCRADKRPERGREHQWYGRGTKPGLPRPLKEGGAWDGTRRKISKLPTSIQKKRAQTALRLKKKRHCTDLTRIAKFQLPVWRGKKGKEPKICDAGGGLKAVKNLFRTNKKRR